MNLKRKISILMFCLVIMGALPSKVVMAQMDPSPSDCTHPIFRVTLSAYKEEYHDEYRHYIISGTEYYCTSCGYTYWEDLTVTSENHTWGYKVEIIDGKKAEIIYCVDCGFVPSYYP